MKFDNKIWGLRLELAGLFLVLITAIWQVAFTDWFEGTAQDWVQYIQEDVNSVTIRALKDISSQIAESDPVARKKLANNVYEYTSKAQIRMIKERNKRNMFMKKGQYVFFMSVRAILFIFGAFLMVLGKWLLLKSQMSSSHANLNN